jgi:hypothetical protein
VKCVMRPLGVRVYVPLAVAHAGTLKEAQDEEQPVLEGDYTELGGLG